MKINGKRLLDNLHSIKKYTDTPGEGVTRFSYGAQDSRAREYIIKRAEAAGCSVHIDALQNILIDLGSNREGRPYVICGSHIDTVRNGGWLDGIYGVCGTLEVMETLAENGIPAASGGTSENAASEDSLPANFRMVIFAEEEGSGFGSTMTGSKFIAGIYKDPDLDHLVNDDGETLREVLSRLSAVPETVTDGSVPGTDASNALPVYSTEAFSPENTLWDFDKVKTMLELHIEQGPVLDREGLSLGIVDSIFGMRVIEVTLTGVGNHAGATPMSERYDALCTASECILAAESIVKTDEDKRTVVTVGKVDILSNCSNVIPETVKFTLEVRDKDEGKINGFMDRIIEEIKRIAAGRSVGCDISELSKSSPLHLCDRLIDSMAERAAEQQLAYKVMDSGAVHDACMIAQHADTGMIFVPSIDGRSHVPEEDTNEEDLLMGAQFLLDTVLNELQH